MRGRETQPHELNGRMLPASIQSNQREGIDQDKGFHPVYLEPMLRMRSGDNTPVLKLDSVILDKAWKEMFLYDELGRIKNIFIMEWDKEMSVWAPFWGMEEFIYRDDGLLEEFSKYVWYFGSNKLVRYDRTLYAYDERGFHSTTIVMGFIPDSSEWIKRNQFDYEYDDRGNRIAAYASGQHYGSGEWTHWNKTLYTFNDSDQHTREITYAWDNEHKRYIPATKIEYQYTQHGQIKDRYHYIWSDQAGQWVSRSWQESVYDDHQNLVSQVMHTRSSETWPWVARHKDEYRYDAYGNPIKYEPSEYLNGQWQAWEQTELVFNHAYSFSDLALPPNWSHYRGMLPTSKLSSFSTRYRRDGSWSNEYTFHLFYSAHSDAEVASKDEPAVPAIMPYPNPVKELLNVQLPANVPEARFLLYDTAGRLLMSRVIKGQDSFSLPEIKPGVYVYRITGHGLVQSGKILKE